MTTKWQTLQQYLKDRDLVRMHFDIPIELRDELRLAAAQDNTSMRDIYVDALIECLKERKINRYDYIKRSSRLKLDIENLE